eukprot:1135796-Amphidinium_carterae.3
MNLCWCTVLASIPSDGWLWTSQQRPASWKMWRGYYTDSHEKVLFLLPGLKQSVYRAEFLAVVRALEECQPRVMAAVDHSRVTAADLYSNGQADTLANQGTDEHGPLTPDVTWSSWGDGGSPASGENLRFGYRL